MAQALLLQPPDRNCIGRSCKSRNCWISQWCDRVFGARSYSFGMPWNNSIPCMRAHDIFGNFISASDLAAPQRSAKDSFRSTDTCSLRLQDRTWCRRCTFHILAFLLSRLSPFLSTSYFVRVIVQQIQRATRKCPCSFCVAAGLSSRLLLRRNLRHLDAQMSRPSIGGRDAYKDVIQLYAVAEPGLQRASQLQPALGPFS